MSLLSDDDPDNECVPEIYDRIDSRFNVLKHELKRGDTSLST